MKRLIILMLVVASAGCVPRSTKPTEWGVQVNKLTGKMDADNPPGGTYFFAPFVTDWYTFTTATVVLGMTLDNDGDDREEKDDVEFKTRDGNDIAVDLTLSYHVDHTKLVNLLKTVARSDAEVKELVVRPLARTIPRDALNVLTSEDIYTSKKFEAAAEAVKQLNAVLDPYGIVVEAINLGDHRFHPDYQKAINDKKVFDQEVNTNISAAQNASKEWLANLERTKGDVEQSVASENGRLEQAQLDADAYYFSKQKEAEAILAEKQARAKGLTKLREAMQGSGGRTRIKMRLAEALQGKRIIVVPSTGAGAMSINKLNVNDLLRTSAAQTAQE